jgi:flagellar motility protein MotE (MotC chaperone)
MNRNASGLFPGAKSFTYQRNGTGAIEIPDTSFHTKGMLRRLIESQCYEMASKDRKHQENTDLLMKEIASLRERLKISEGETKRLLDQRILDQQKILQQGETIGQQKDELIEIYLKLTEGKSPLKVTA